MILSVPKYILSSYYYSSMNTVELSDRIVKRSHILAHWVDDKRWELWFYQVIVKYTGHNHGEPTEGMAVPPLGVLVFRL